MASVVPARAGGLRIASTSASGSAFGSRLAGAGGFTPAAGSAAASPSPTANLWNPRTATTVRAAEVEHSGGWSASPSRSRTRNAVTVASSTRSRSSTPRSARNAWYLRRSRRYDVRVLAASPRSTDRWSRYGADRPAPGSAKRVSSRETGLDADGLADGRRW